MLCLLEIQAWKEAIDSLLLCLLQELVREETEVEGDGTIQRGQSVWGWGAVVYAVGATTRVVEVGVGERGRDQCLLQIQSDHMFGTQHHLQYLCGEMSD